MHCERDEEEQEKFEGTVINSMRVTIITLDWQPGQLRAGPWWSAVAAAAASNLRAAELSPQH